MDLPVIETPIAPRWVWMEEVTYSHIPIATIITAFLVLAPIYEYIGYRRKDPRFDRLAKSIVYFSMILYSPGAALGTGIPMFIIGLWPEFWSRWVLLFFWPLFFQFLFFLTDVGFLFFGYYLPWDRMRDRKRLHIFFGVITAIFGLLIQAVWDSLGGYMTTPGVPFPEISDPVGWSAQAFFNPSYPFLFFHRFFGNISYAMLLAGGVFALKYWRQKDPPGKGILRVGRRFNLHHRLCYRFRHALYWLGVCQNIADPRTGGFSFGNGRTCIHFFHCQNGIDGFPGPGGRCVPVQAAYK